MLYLRYSFFAGLPILNTTHAATASLPWIFELSKHSICTGGLFMQSSFCISLSSFMLRCSGLSFSVCFSLSILYCFTFCSDISSNFFLSPRWGTINSTFSNSRSGRNGTTISRDRLLKRVRNSAIPNARISSFASSSLFLYSIVKLCTIEPLRICM